MGAVSQRRARAFTLVEVLAASAVAAVLMASVLGVVTMVVRDRVKLRVPKDPASELEPVIGLLSRDVANARYFSQAPDGQRLTLTGFGGIDLAARVPDARPARIEYRVEERGGRHWLARAQIPLDAPQGAAPTTWVVSGNIIGVLLEPVDEQQGGIDGDARTPDTSSDSTSGAAGRSAVAENRSRPATLAGEIPQVLKIRLILPQEGMATASVITR